jgi:EmrB/QacA subfamily drug resistance transporter
MTETGIGDDDTIPGRAWWALSVSTLVVFLVVIDISAVNVAFPSIREDFDVSDSQLSWIIGAYNIVVGSLLMLSGRLADSMGRRKVYLPGVAVFGLGSLLCGLAPAAGWLIAARIVQAVGGSIVFAAGFAVMLPEFPATKRGTAIGVAGATGALGAVVGPVLGSILIDLFSWRSIFFMNVPMCVLVLIVGPRLLSESRDPDASGRIDRLGVAVGTAAVAFAMFGIVRSETWGVADLRVVALFVAGVALVPVLIHRSRVHPEPLIDLRLFRYRSFSSTNLGVSFYGLAFTSGFLANSLMLQDVWDLPIREVGLALAPAPVLAAVVSPLTGRWADRIGHRWLLGGGCLALAASYLAYVVLIDEQATVWTRFVPISLLGGLGVGLTVATWSSAGISDVPAAKFGVAGATYNTIRQAAYGLGVAVVITLIASGGDTTTIEGVHRAYLWAFAAYLAAGIAVMATFPAGSARDRASVPVERVRSGS